MSTLAVLPCVLVVRPYKGMSMNKFDMDIELDRIQLANSVARRAAKKRAEMYDRLEYELSIPS